METKNAKVAKNAKDAKRVKKHRAMLLAAESSVRKDWDSAEEDAAWADL